jgi:hypothetical protein
MSNKEILVKTVKTRVHYEEVAFGGRGDIAAALSKQLIRAIYENMTVEDTEEEDMLDVSITVYIKDNRNEWRDRNSFKEQYTTTYLK